MTKKKLLLSLGLVVVGFVAFITLLVFPTIPEIRNLPLVENTLTRVLCQYGQGLWVYVDPSNPSEYPLYCTNVEGVGYNAIKRLILIDAVLAGLFLISGLWFIFSKSSQELVSPSHNPQAETLS